MASTKWLKATKARPVWRASPQGRFRQFSCQQGGVDEPRAALVGIELDLERDATRLQRAEPSLQPGALERGQRALTQHAWRGVFQHQGVGVSDTNSEPRVLMAVVAGQPRDRAYEVELVPAFQEGHRPAAKPVVDVVGLLVQVEQELGQEPA